MRFGFHSALATLVLASLPASVLAATVPSAIYTDPPHDAKFPASTAVLHIPTHGVAINGLAYLPSAPGAHPVLVICHGLPGNEKNLDLAQAVRRAGWVAATDHSWSDRRIALASSIIDWLSQLPTTSP